MPGTDLKNLGKLEIKVSKTRCERKRRGSTLMDMVSGIVCLLVGNVAKILLAVRLCMENIEFDNCITLHSRCKGNLNRVNGFFDAISTAYLKPWLHIVIHGPLFVAWILIAGPWIGEVGSLE